MALQTTTQIFISGAKIQGYVSLRLIQQIDAHHDLELVCRTDVVEKLSEELIGDSKEYLGAVITIKISTDFDFSGYKELDFKGVVTKVNSTKGFQYSEGDLLTIYAKSCSILADDGPHYASFNDVTLSDILSKTFQEYDTSKLATSFDPNFTGNIQYSVQHNQSAFSYASRLAAYYNQWFYYDGQQLVFGNPSDIETELINGVDLQDFSIELHSIPNSFQYFTNDYITGELYQKSSSDVSIPAEGYHGFTSNKSKELFSKQTQVYHHLQNGTAIKSQLDTQVEQYTKARAMQQVIGVGFSDNPGVQLGALVKIRGFGTYRITKITHTNIEGGTYKNTFEAVDADFIAYPNMDINRFPKSDGVQIATVMDNNDPDGLGRVKVQFPWQKPEGQTTPWLRVMTPYAGSDKGFHFVSEIAEEVVVNFEGGNIERPFVVGALYNGTAKPSSWQTQNNDIKAIRTRSGHTIELNDTEGEEKINIYDNEGSLIEFNTQEKTLNINAAENINMSAKNIRIEAEENITIGAKQNVEVAAEGDLSNLSQGNLKLQSSGDTSVKSTGALALESTSDATLKGINAIIEGTASAEVNAVQAKLNGSAMTEVAGAIVKLN